MNVIARAGESGEHDVDVLRAPAEQAQLAGRGATVSEQILVDAGKRTAVAAVVLDMPLIRHDAAGARRIATPDQREGAINAS